MKGLQTPKIQNFLNATIQKCDRKKVPQILKIFEDWLKNYQILNQVEQQEERVLKHEDINQKLVDLIAKKQLSPYDNETFCTFLLNIFETNFLNLNIVEMSDPDAYGT